MERGEIWWASLPRPGGSVQGFRRPVLLVQSDSFNQSNIQTIVAVVITSNMRLAKAPGNVPLSQKQSGLPKPSVINVSQMVTLDKTSLVGRVGKLERAELRHVDEGMRLVLSL
jgi:mRNA interferase MazF